MTLALNPSPHTHIVPSSSTTYVKNDDKKHAMVIIWIDITIESHRFYQIFIQNIIQFIWGEELYNNKKVIQIKVSPIDNVTSQLHY